MSGYPMVTYINTAHGREIFDPSNREHRLIMSWANFCTKHNWAIISLDEWLLLPEAVIDPWVGTTTA